MKKVKMLLYGAPGVGKSVFALGFPKPFFITTDGNYEWLEDFGADPKAYAQPQSWLEAKRIFGQDFNEYDTIVVDLLEDLYKWCTQEVVAKNGLQHIGDLGYGKGYDMVDSDFFTTISKLINADKNVVFLTHETCSTSKDRYGVEHSYSAPSDKIRRKVLDSIEGRLRYVLHCYMTTSVKDQEDGSKKLVNERFLSLVPKDDEFGIIRGVDVNNIPQDIPLDAKLFLQLTQDAKNQTNTSVRSFGDGGPKLSIEYPEPKKVEVKEIKEEPKEEVKPDLEVTNELEKKSNIKVEVVNEKTPEKQEEVHSLTPEEILAKLNAVKAK